MDENTWKIVQILIGQTTLICGLMVLMWKHFNDRFDKVDQRFEKVDQRFESLTADMNSRFEKMDQRFEKIDQRFDKIEEKITDIDRRVCRIEGALSSKDCCMLKDDRAKQRVE